MSPKDYNLRFYENSPFQNTNLYGKTHGKFRRGLVSSNQKIAIYLLDLDSDLLVWDVYYNPASPSYHASGFELFEFLGEGEGNLAEDALISKTILRIDLSTYELRSHTSYIPKNEWTLMEFARRWKGGFLLEHTGIVSDFGENTTQYLSTDLSESILWDCSAPNSPPPGVLYFDVDFYLTVGEHAVGGFDYSSCKSWTINTLAFFGIPSCPGCTTSLKLLNQTDANITVEVRVNEETRHAVMVYRTGELISNVVVD